MNRQYLENRILKAWEMAENRSEGSILLQLHPSNRKIITSWQLGNSWESMGLNAIESEDRILWKFPCSDYEPMYWEGEKKIKANRLNAEEQNHDLFEEMCNEIETQIEGFEARE